MHTPYLPALRARLAALGRRTTRTLRQISLPELARCLETYLPAYLFASEDQGANSRERIYTLRLTFQAFLWQMLKPRRLAAKSSVRFKPGSDCRSCARWNRAPAPTVRHVYACLESAWKKLCPNWLSTLTDKPLKGDA